MRSFHRQTCVFIFKSPIWYPAMFWKSICLHALHSSNRYCFTSACLWLQTIQAIRGNSRKQGAEEQHHSPGEVTLAILLKAALPVKHSLFFSYFD